MTHEQQLWALTGGVLWGTPFLVLVPYGRIWFAIRAATKAILPPYRRTGRPERNTGGRS